MSKAEDEASDKIILSNYQRILRSLQESVAAFADPAKVDPQIILDLETQKALIESFEKNGSMELSSEEHLAVFDNLEKWYKSHGLEYPFPDWLIEQRKIWEDKS